MNRRDLLAVGGFAAAATAAGSAGWALTTGPTPTTIAGTVAARYADGEWNANQLSPYTLVVDLDGHLQTYAPVDVATYRRFGVGDPVRLTCWPNELCEVTL